jgi:hypothetical protein
MEFFGCEALGAFWAIIDRVNEACRGICIADWAIVDVPMNGSPELHFIVTATWDNDESAKPT